jgi:hypothetical protein
MRNLTDLEVLALSRLITDDTVDRARESVQPGDYVVPFDLEGIMELSVGTRYNQRSPIRSKPWHIILRLLGEVNTLRAEKGESSLDINALALEVHDGDDKLPKRIEKEVTEALKAQMTAPLIECRGQISIGRREIRSRK